MGALGAVLALALASGSDYASVKRKIALIENEHAPRGSYVTLSARELTAYVEGELPDVAPQGARNPRVQLGSGTASGTALIDFLKLREGRGIETGWFLTRLLEGERPVKVAARIRSARGSAQVDVERVEISGVPVSGGALDFLIRNYLLPRFPDAKIGQPFELGHGIDRLEVRPGEVRVVLKN